MTREVYLEDSCYYYYTPLKEKLLCELRRDITSNNDLSLKDISRIRNEIRNIEISGQAFFDEVERRGRWKIGRSGDFKARSGVFFVASAYCPEFRDEGRIDPRSRGARTRTLSRIILATRGKISIPRVDAGDGQTKGQKNFQHNRPRSFFLRLNALFLSLSLSRSFFQQSWINQHASYKVEKEEKSYRHVH